MQKLENIHPGEVLYVEFLNPNNISILKLSEDTEIPEKDLAKIISGSKRISADIALRLSSYFGTTAKFWLGLQDDFDIEEENKNSQDILTKIKNKAPRQMV